MRRRGMNDDERDEIKKVFAAAPKAPETPESPEGAGIGARVVGRVRFPDISPRAYEHPADRAALAGLRKVAGFDQVLRKLFSLVSERSLRFHFLANGVRVDARQFPKLNAVYEECCAILDLPKRPDLFVTQTPFVNAGAVGIDDPFIVLNSGVLGLLDADEQRFVLGHELGHVLSGHSLYRHMLFVLLNFVMPILWRLPFAGLAVQGVIAGLLEWSRKSELSCDRAGLLCLQDPARAYGIHMKMAGGGKASEMDVDAFVEQARAYETEGDLRDGLIKLLSALRSTHPFPVVRLAEMKRWVDRGEYGRIVGGEYARRSEDGVAGVYDDVAGGAEAYRRRWSEGEDPVAKALQGLGEMLGEAGSSVWDQVRDFFKREGKGGSEGSDDGAGEER